MNRSIQDLIGSYLNAKKNVGVKELRGLEYNLIIFRVTKLKATQENQASEKKRILIEKQTDNSTDLKDLGYEIFIAMVSVLSVINMGMLWFPGMDQNTINLISIMNSGLTLIFLIDFVYRFTTTDSKYRYFIKNWGWADLLACIPQLRIFRIFRIFKAYRLVNSMGIKAIIKHLSDNRAETALYILVFSVFIILELGSFFILIAERSSSAANILTASDAIWWTYVTITTVGYGDRYPVTTAGRIVGILVLTTGVGVFATFAGYISNKLLAPKEENKGGKADINKVILDKLEELHKSINDLKTNEKETTLRVQQIEQMIKEIKQ